MTAKQYRVVVYRTVEQHATITISASSPKEAEEIARNNKCPVSIGAGYHSIRSIDDA